MYAYLDRVHLFQPVACETCGAVGPESMCFLRDLMQETHTFRKRRSQFIILPTPVPFSGHLSGIHVGSSPPLTLTIE